MVAQSPFPALPWRETRLGASPHRRAESGRPVYARDGGLRLNYRITVYGNPIIEGSANRGTTGTIMTVMRQQHTGCMVQ